MDTSKHTFRPEDIDMDIDQLLKNRHQEEHASLPKAHLVYEMKDLYGRGRYEDESQILDRAWERLTQQIQNPLESLERYPKQREKSLGTVRRSTQKSGLKQRLAGMGLGLVAALVLVSTVIIFTLQQQDHTTYEARNHSTPQVQTPGRVVFRSQSENGDGRANWPSAGPRLITTVEKQTSMSIFSGTIKIVDARTNQTYASIPLEANELADVAESSWSPAGNLLAIPTSERVIIVSGQTGHIITSHWASLSLTTPEKSTTVLTSMEIHSTPSSTQSSPGAFSYASSFRGIAWSPDGKLLASSYSLGAVLKGSPSTILRSPSTIQIWNPMTGDVSTSLTTDPGWAVAEISWSSDGTYIAANVATSPTQNQVVVWNVKTQQIVFQHAFSQELAGSTWQPGTHNLAFSLLANGAFNGVVMNVWNIDTRELMKTFPGVTASEMAWSPNGDEIVYNSMAGDGKTDAVTIMDIKSGQNVYTYQVTAPSQHTINIGSPAWSPDGKYILTCAVTTATKLPTPGSPVQPPSHIVTIWES